MAAEGNAAVAAACAHVLQREYPEIAADASSPTLPAKMVAMLEEFSLRQAVLVAEGQCNSGLRFYHNPDCFINFFYQNVVAEGKAARAEKKAKQLSLSERKAREEAHQARARQVAALKRAIQAQRSDAR